MTWIQNTSTWMTWHTQMIFHKRLADGGKMYPLKLSLSHIYRLNFVCWLWLVSKCSCDFKLLLTLPVGSCACERSFSALRNIKTWCRATMTENRLYWLAMLHLHRNDTVGHVNPEAVLKRWNSSGNRKIHLAFTDWVLSFEIIQQNIKLDINQLG